MSNLAKYIQERKERDKEFADNFDEGYYHFKIGVILKQAREKAGITQVELAQKLNIKRTAITRIENHSEDIRLSILEKYANALGKSVQIQLIEN
jgi:HTH-type transcriptional regulator/antitoxin HipB